MLEIFCFNDYWVPTMCSARWHILPYKKVTIILRSGWLNSYFETFRDWTKWQSQRTRKGLGQELFSGSIPLRCSTVSGALLLLFGPGCNEDSRVKGPVPGSLHKKLDSSQDSRQLVDLWSPCWRGADNCLWRQDRWVTVKSFLDLFSKEPPPPNPSPTYGNSTAETYNSVVFQFVAVSE